jgi:hypothetical protein
MKRLQGIARAGCDALVHRPQTSPRLLGSQNQQTNRSAVAKVLSDCGPTGFIDLNEVREPIHDRFE